MCDQKGSPTPRLNALKAMAVSSAEMVTSETRARMLPLSLICSEESVVGNDAKEQCLVEWGECERPRSNRSNLDLIRDSGCARQAAS